MRKTLIALVSLAAASLTACAGGQGSGQEPGSVTRNPPPATPPPTPPAPAPVVPPGEPPACSPCKKIAFVSTRDGNSEIYSVDADGTKLTRLTDNYSYDGAPAWSPDGQRIVFISDRDLEGSWRSSNTAELYSMDADGGNVRRLTFSNGYASGPAWSPDGTRIVYAQGDLYEIPADGGTPELLFSTPGVDTQPAWSPDGTRLALASDWFAYDFGTDVFLINDDGSGFTAVTDRNISEHMYYEDPAWSPDGVRIALTVLTDPQSIGDSYVAQLGVIDASGLGLTTLPTPGGQPFDGIKAGTPSWSPDGTMIAYTLCLGSRCDVAWIKADGSAQGTIITNGSDPDWQR